MARSRSHVLRQTVGDDRFFAILRSWVADHTGGSATTDDFVDHASKIAGEDLTGLFMTWLSGTSVPEPVPDPTARLRPVPHPRW